MSMASLPHSLALFNLGTDVFSDPAERLCHF